jgi:hypothetical protein
MMPLLYKFERRNNAGWIFWVPWALVVIIGRELS